MILEADQAFLEHYSKKGMKQGVVNEGAGTSNVKLNTKPTKNQSIKTNTRNAKASALKVDPIDKQGRRKLTDNQKKALKGAVVVGGVLAAYGVYHMAQSGQMNSSMMKGASFVTGKPVLKKNPELSKAMSPDEIVSKISKQVNPDYGKPGTAMNCRRATYAHEMRRRGYDVRATKTTNGWGQDFAGFYNATNVTGSGRIKSGTRGMRSELYGEALKARIKGSDSPFLNAYANRGDSMSKNPIARADDIFSSLSKNPEGARGELAMTWVPGGGHSMAWEIIGGKPHVFDGQTGQRYASNADLIKDIGEGLVGTSSWTRLDNLPFNEAFMTRWVTNV